MSEFPESWAALALRDAVINVTITDKKIPQKEYLSEGAFPVFDQGQDYIGGYCDKKEKLVNCELPILVFGDHTRVVKFVNQPFAPGADGIKILQPQHFYNPRLLEYFTRHIATHITNHGYARHYQHLVKSIIPLPPTNEQHRIVAKIEELFSELDKGVENLKTAQAQLKVYRQALLKHAFEGKLTAQWRAERNATSNQPVIPCQLDETDQNPVISCHPDKTIQKPVIPANAGIQPLNAMDSSPRQKHSGVTFLRGNDEMRGGNDGIETAEVLLKRIQQERAQRYQQQLANWQTHGGTKPKAPKSLPPLTAEELAELPALPEGWAWVKLGELTWSVKDGPHFSPKYVEKGIPFISGGNIRPDGVDFEKAKHISRELHEELSKRCKPEMGDILYTKGGTTGIARVNTFDVDFNVWVHVAVLKLTPFVKPFYVQHALNSSFCYSQSQKYTHGVGNQDLGLTRMVNIVLAICSTEEQVEVIKIIDDKMSVIDQLDQTITTALQQAEALRQSILKRAFSGQLVAQDPNDEPASALLARIKADTTNRAPAAPTKRATKSKLSPPNTVDSQ